VALGYAAEVTGGVDAVALTHLDTAARLPQLSICRAYDLGGTVVSRIEPGPARDLAYQESLTAALLKARPIYDQAERDTVTNTGDYWADAVTSIVDAPVVIRSHGPAVTDKAWRSPQALSR
jgi:adenylosuccinate synthase